MAARRLLGAVALLAFMLNVGTPTIMHGCEHADAAMAEAQHGHQQHQAPAGPHQKQCHCVGQSCGSALAVPVQPAAAPLPAPVAQVIESFRQDGQRPLAAPHLLPFAIGPPRSILA